jgi:hypothetical protein
VDRLPTLPSALARLDDFADSVEGLRFQVRYKPVTGLDFCDCIQVLRGRMQLIRISLIDVPAVGILVLHRPEVFLKSMLKDFLGVEILAPEASHASPPLNAAS